jgi:hypothetical protein
MIAHQWALTLACELGIVALWSLYACPNDAVSLGNTILTAVPMLLVTSTPAE